MLVCPYRVGQMRAHRGPKQETPIDMHLINTSNIHGRFATSLSGAARLPFDPDYSITPRTNPAPRLFRLVRGHYNDHACTFSEETVHTHAFMTDPGARLWAPRSSSVALNVSLRKEK